MEGIKSFGRAMLHAALLIVLLASLCVVLFTIPRVVPPLIDQFGMALLGLLSVDLSPRWLVAFAVSVWITLALGIWQTKRDRQKEE